MTPLFQRLSTDTFNTILIIGILLVILEVVFFNGWLIFSVLINAVIAFLGWKNFKRVWGKVFFFIGVISLFFTILNMIAVRFIIVAGLILFFMDYQRMKKDPLSYTPYFVQPKEPLDEEPLVKVEPLLQNRLFGDQYTSRSSYRWTDVNIHSGFGDRVLDLSNTVLPEQADISIRHFIGNVVIYVPYEVEVSIHHSSIFGRATILGEHQEKLLNDTISFHTEYYDTLHPRVKIVTSIISGDLEVKRI
ncbi:cell wall-active antibiotics response protein LiaF [Salirhabdus sp. Marseille-P4669]|uniref:cell wall-active antibiotics response protein LiaF n=1 Tax=Salirhabdus sp. Marseille-P4669 TaxID=2042310 RepID=UPI00279636BC|nr:cell wall-active antibiotics response protein LiaF [Salirhabdus sp. Marseille-P4669]